jgi:Mg2+-importing ATPase
VTRGALASDAAGLSSAEAERRLGVYGRNELGGDRDLSRAWVLLAQLRSPLLWLLAFAAIVSALSGEWADALIVFAILSASVAIGYSREYGAQAAVAALRARVRTRVCALRDGQPQMIDLSRIVPGDVVRLSAGALVPADAVVFEANDLFVAEAVLTGESFPVAKQPARLAADAAPAERGNTVFLGTSVRSGDARCLVVATGAATAFGSIAHRLSLRPPETDFDRGVRRFGYLLTAAMSVLVLLVFGAHVLRGRPPLETMLFAIALAVGLSPELLPAILSVNLARGAQAMARRKVLVRRLNAIENLGSMTVLCTDKTGTLTEGVVHLDGAYDAGGAPSPRVLELGAINAELTAGIANPLDEAILRARRPDPSGPRKLAEIPFDFIRKRVSVIVEDGGAARVITKGAFRPVLDACTQLATGAPLDGARRAELERRYAEWSGQGTRVVAVAARELPREAEYGRADERELRFEGFLAFLDRPKEGVREAIADLARLGVATKLISGDTKLVAQHVARLVGLRDERVLTGAELSEMHDEALWRQAERTDLFVEVDPNQKERIILALKKMSHVVGFLGDGVNDAPAMHAADVSLSVEHAVDVAREAADFVLLERHLDVIRGGIEEGRKTFANTLKYVSMTTSANLGNMVSMALASLFLPFLPLTAGQILLNNLLSDIPAIGLADDSVDPELVQRPERWDQRFIARFMLEFGVLSSAFDLLTFAVLRRMFAAPPALFRTGWFVESLITELVVALVVRTRRPFFRSRPGRLLWWSTVVLVVVAFAIPYLPFVKVLGFVPLPAGLVAMLVLITFTYVWSAELLKRWFYRPRPRRVRAA